MTITTTPFDAAVVLDTDEAQVEFLRDALETGDADYIAHATGIVARATGMSDLAAATGKSRQSLYRSLSSGGNPTLDTFFRALNAMGIKLSIDRAAGSG